jgi:tRNA threonylcarbamoyladenosine modification (KEOPS) complex  Pcc1 subunit
MHQYKVDFQITEDADELFDCLKIEDKKRDRSTLDITKEGKVLKISMSASDATALRASFDGLIKLIITYEKMKGVK